MLGTWGEEASQGGRSEGPAETAPPPPPGPPQAQPFHSDLRPTESIILAFQASKFPVRDFPTQSLTSEKEPVSWTRYEAPGTATRANLC